MFAQDILDKIAEVSSACFDGVKKLVAGIAILGASFYGTRAMFGKAAEVLLHSSSKSAEAQNINKSSATQHVFNKTIESAAQSSPEQPATAEQEEKSLAQIAWDYCVPYKNASWSKQIRRSQEPEEGQQSARGQ